MKKLMVILAVIMMVTLNTYGLSYDQNVTPDVVFGSGNANGAWAVDQVFSPGDALMELGLRAKLRYDQNGQPQNIFNSNGDGTYTFNAGQAPGQSPDTAEWCFEWSVNTNFANGSDSVMDLVLYEYTYELKIDYDPSAGTDFVTFDPINVSYADHAIGNNSTGNGAGLVAANATEYANFISTYNVAQNSWQMKWFDDGLADSFDPTVTGTYDFVLQAYKGSDLQACTTMQVNVVPEPMTLGILGLGSVFLRKRK